MAPKDFSVSPTSVADSNMLLRALWAQLRARFGRLGWLLAPRRDGSARRVWIGHADLGLANPVGVSIFYRKRGIAATIRADDLRDEHVAAFEACISAAAEVRHSPSTRYLAQTIATSAAVPMAPVRGTHFAIDDAREGEFRLRLAVISFDREDAKAEASLRIARVLDVLAIMTNVRYARARSDGEPPFKPPLEVHFVQIGDDGLEVSAETTETPGVDPLPRDWIDGYAINQGRLVLRESAVRLIDLICSNPFGEFQAAMADAAHHFHCGLQVESLEGGSTPLDRVNSELSVVCYLSSLEVASLIGADAPQSCDSCGQVKYTISARVTGFVEARASVYAVKLVKDLYAARSGYLHRGALLSARSYAGTFIPQLDPNSESGVVASRPMAPVYNLREVASYCMRKLVDERLGMPEL